MTVAAIREKLHGYIDSADDSKIKNIYALFEDQMAPSVDWWEDKEFIAELEERDRRYEEGIEKTYTLEKTKQWMEEQKRKLNP